MTIFFYKRSTKNLKIGNTAIWVFSDIWRLRRVMYTKIDTNIFNEMLLNDAKCQGYSFYRFWVIMGKPTWQKGWLESPPPPNPHTHPD